MYDDRLRWQNFKFRTTVIPWDGHDKAHFEGFEKRCRENSPMMSIPLFKNRTLPITSEGLFQSIGSPFLLNQK